MNPIKITSIPLSDTLVPDKYNSNNHHTRGVTYEHVLSEEEYSFYKVLQEGKRGEERKSSRMEKYSFYKISANLIKELECRRSNIK
jgi:hypothetical protein